MVHSLLFSMLLAQFDGSLLKTGRFHYDVRSGDKEVATGVLNIENRSESLFFTGTFTASVCQHWESTASPGFVPRSATLRFCKDGPDRPVFELNYSKEGNRVRGVRYVKSEKTDVNAAIPTHTVDQRIDWAAVMALPLKPGYKFEFKVYDPGTGLSPLLGSVDDEQTIETPAGRFKVYQLTYQMNKPGREEHYQSWVTADSPRMLVRIRFPDGSVSSLTRFE
jgi:hypothetical protein